MVKWRVRRGGGTMPRCGEGEGANASKPILVPRTRGRFLERARALVRSAPPCCSPPPRHLELEELVAHEPHDEAGFADGCVAEQHELEVADAVAGHYQGLRVCEKVKKKVPWGGRKEHEVC